MMNGIAQFGRNFLFAVNFFHFASSIFNKFTDFLYPNGSTGNSIPLCSDRNTSSSSSNGSGVQYIHAKAFVSVEKSLIFIPFHRNLSSLALLLKSRIDFNRWNNSYVLVFGCNFIWFSLGRDGRCSRSVCVCVWLDLNWNMIFLSNTKCEYVILFSLKTEQKNVIFHEDVGCDVTSVRKEHQRVAPTTFYVCIERL